MNVRANRNIFLVLSAFLLGIACTATGRTIYVDCNAPGPTHDGKSWATAFKYLQEGLTTAWMLDEIRVAQGIYRSDPNGLADPRETTFEMEKVISIKGGYTGFGHPDPNARDINKYETILSGDLHGNDVDVNDPRDLLTEPTRSDNAYTVVSIWPRSGVRGITLDGFTITGGNANGDWPGPHTRKYGGGMWTQFCWPRDTLKVINCTFITNSAEWKGGGMANVGGSSPTLTNCKFIKNSGCPGGAIWNQLGDPILIDCTFSGNLARYGDGGGMYNYHSSPTLTNCLFNGNSAVYGGGMYNYNYSRPRLTNCVFVGNFGETGAGMFNYNYSAPMLVNCSFSENGSHHSGGGIVSYDSTPTLTNCTFTRNSAEKYDAGGMWNSRSSPTLTNCTFSGNSANSRGGGMYNFNYSSPTLTNCIFSGNSAEVGGGAMYTDFCNSDITNCTFSDNSASDGNALACHSYKQKRPSNLRVANCILWDGGNEIWNNDGSTITVTYSDVNGGQTGVYDPYGGLVWGTGNTDADPFFVKLGYWSDANDPNIIVEPNDPNAIWVNGDYHLLPGSPCVDAGDNTAVLPDIVDIDGDGNIAEPTPWELEGNLRFLDDPNTPDTGYATPPVPVVDMGAYEHPGKGIPGDFEPDGDVDFDDFAIFALAWLTEPEDAGWNPDCDISIPADNYIDWGDLQVFKDNWLAGAGP